MYIGYLLEFEYILRRWKKRETEKEREGEREREGEGGKEREREEGGKDANAVLLG